jgi:hypothetical protein
LGQSHHFWPTSSLSPLGPTGFQAPTSGPRMPALVPRTHPFPWSPIRGSACQGYPFRLARAVTGPSTSPSCTSTHLTSPPRGPRWSASRLARALGLGCQAGGGWRPGPSSPKEARVRQQKPTLADFPGARRQSYPRVGRSSTYGAHIALQVGPC